MRVNTTQVPVFWAPVFCLLPPDSAVRFVLFAASPFHNSVACLGLASRLWMHYQGATFNGQANTCTKMALHDDICTCTWRKSGACNIKSVNLQQRFPFRGNVYASPGAWLSQKPSPGTGHFNHFSHARRGPWRYAGVVSWPLRK